MTTGNSLGFLFDDRHRVRVFVKGDETHWVAKDACDVLGLVNSRKALTALDDDEKGVTICDTPGGPQEMATITESGLYHLIFKSQKPEAVRFRKWVTSQVLPTIRRTGTFGLESQIKKLLALREEDRKYWIARDTETNERLNQQGQQIQELVSMVQGIRHPKAIGKVAGKKIKDRIMQVARDERDSDAANDHLSQVARKEKRLKIRKEREDELRRLIGFPRDTGNSFENLPSDRAGDLHMHLNTMEVTAKRLLERRLKAEAKACQQDLFKKN